MARRLQIVALVALVWTHPQSAAFSLPVFGSKALTNLPSFDAKSLQRRGGGQHSESQRFRPSSPLYSASTAATPSSLILPKPTPPAPKEKQEEETRTIPVTSEQPDPTKSADDSKKDISVVSVSTASSSSSVITGSGTASSSSMVFNLIKTIVGAGVLGLPAGIASFGNAPSAAFPAVALTIAVAALAAYNFSLIGLVCGRTQSLSYQDAWSRSVGPRTSWVPTIAAMLVCSCSCLTFQMVLANTIPDVVQSFTGITLSRVAASVGVTTGVILPLCLLRSLKALSPFSLVGIFGVLYTATVMVVRWLSGSYAVPHGPLAQTLAPHLVPQFGSKGWASILSPNAVIFASMLSTAFQAHYNCPKIFWELKDNTMKRFNKVVSLSYLGAILLMGTTAIAGFCTFGAASSGVILNNYAISDMWMSFSRAAVTLSVMTSFPLVFGAIREGIFDLCRMSTQRRNRLSAPATVVLVSLITALAFVVKDVRIIIALSGTTWGNALMYIMPPLMVYNLAKKQPDLKRKVPLAVGSGIIGGMLGVVGVIRAVRSI